MLSLVDRAETAFVLTDTVKQYLSSIGNSRNSNSTPTSLSLAIGVLKLVTYTCGHHLNGMRTAVNNTKVKQNANQSHNKHTTDNRQQVCEEQLQHRALTPTNPRKILQTAISNTKQQLNSRHQLAVAVPESDADSTIIAHHAK